MSGEGEGVAGGRHPSLVQVPQLVHQLAEPTRRASQGDQREQELLVGVDRVGAQLQHMRLAVRGLGAVQVAGQVGEHRPDRGGDDDRLAQLVGPRHPRGGGEVAVGRLEIEPHARRADLQHVRQQLEDDEPVPLRDLAELGDDTVPLCRGHVGQVHLGLAR